jgi:hypothetical protein
VFIGEETEPPRARPQEVFVLEFRPNVTRLSTTCNLTHFDLSTTIKGIKSKKLTENNW